MGFGATGGLAALVSFPRRLMNKNQRFSSFRVSVHVKQTLLFCYMFFLVVFFFANYNKISAFCLDTTFFPGVSKEGPLRLDVDDLNSLETP